MLRLLRLQLSKDSPLVLGKVLKSLEVLLVKLGWLDLRSVSRLLLSLSWLGSGLNRLLRCLRDLRRVGRCANLRFRLLELLGKLQVRRFQRSLVLKGRLGHLMRLGILSFKLVLNIHLLHSHSRKST